MSTRDLECADALIMRARALLTGDGLLGMNGVAKGGVLGDPRWVNPTIRAAAILAAAGVAILADRIDTFEEPADDEQ